MESQFDDLAALYEDMAQWTLRRDIEIPNVFATLGDVRERDILDFGCGTGMYSRWLKERGARRVVGYDISEGMLSYARRREEKERLGISYSSELSGALYGQFDIVLGVYVLPYARTFEELCELCALMVRALKPGGRLVTLPVHPAYARDRKYYEPYGIRLVPLGEDKDGGQVQLDICKEPYDISVNAYFWSRESLNAALYGAGLSVVQWVEHGEMRTPTSLASDVSPQTYLKKPHAALLNCVNG